MDYQQLVTPDLSVEGQIAFCLQYAARVFHCQTVMFSAWDAWMSTRYPHTDAIPTDVAVPVWFDYTTDGYRYGHVVISVPGQGFYSSPYNKAQGHNVLSSISEIERLYGVKYVGWSEDILERIVIKQGDNTMQADIDELNKQLNQTNTYLQATQDSVAELTKQLDSTNTYLDALTKRVTALEGKSTASTSADGDYHLTKII